MADISKITLPDNSQYDIKVYTDHIAPMMSKTFTGVIGTANNWAGATFFFGKIQPTDFKTLWRITYRIRTYVPGKDYYDQTADVTLSGDQDALRTYSSYNSVSPYYPAYYHVLYRAKAAGISAGYGHALGVRFYSAYSPITAGYERTIDVDIIETINCTFTFYDSCLPYASIPGTGSTNYNTYSEINYCSNGLQESGDANTVNEYAGGITAGPNGLKAYSLALKINEDHWESLHTSSATTATTKVKNPTGFLVTSPMIYCSVNYNSGVVSGSSTTWFACWAIDTRYSFNVSTTSWSANGKPIYLVGTITEDKFYLKDTTWWADALPTSADGYYYWYVGQMINGYQVALHAYHPIYYYDNGIKQYNVATVTEVNGHTVNSNVPTNAKFTDTTYTFDAVDGQLRVTPSSGSSYLVPLGDGNASVVYYELDFNGSSTIEQSGEVASIADQIIQDFEDGNRKIIVGARNTIIDDLIDESETNATNVLYFDITSVSGTESITITGSVFDGVHYINNEAINKYTLIISNTAETGITWVAMMQRNNMIVETDKAGLMDWDSYSQLMNETSRDYSYTPTYNTSNSNKVWKTDANGSPAWRKNDGVSWTLDFNGSDTATVPASMISEIRTAYSGGSVIIVRAINVTLGTLANNSRIEFHMTTIGMTGTFALVGYYVGEPPIAGVSKIMNFILTITPNTVSNLDGTAVIESDNLEVSNTRRGLMAPTVFRQIWNRASSSDDSDASKNTDNANKVWKCDASGNPGWRTDADTTYSTADYNSSGLSSADMYRRVYNVDSTDGSVVSSRDWYVYMTDSNGTPGWRNNAATYNHPGLFGSSQYRQIFNRVSETDDSYNTDHANMVWKCDANGTPAWRADANTTYSDFTAATSSAAGTHGLVPAPAAGKQASYLRGDKTWQAAANNLTTTAGGLLLDARQGKTLNDKITAIEGNDHYTNSIMTDTTNRTIRRFGTDTGKITNSLWEYDLSSSFSSLYFAIVYVDNTSSTWVCTASQVVSNTTVRARLHQRNAMNTNQTVDAGPHVSVVVCGVAK